jgi:dihydrofolate reductase
MAKIVVFNSVSLDGYFTDANSDMSFARNTNPDPEWDAFVSDNANGGGMLLFGRITYDLMVSFWPTPFAVENMPVVAERMNNLPKMVFSKTMDNATWNNTKLVKEDMIGEVKKLRKEPGSDITIMGSGSIIAQLSQHGLIDEYQMVMIPVVLGKGRTMFEGVQKKLSMKLSSTRTFANGNIVLSYKAQ